MKLVKFSVAVGSILVAGALVIFLIKGNTTAIVQPIPFDHLLHAGDQEIECITCHTYAEKHERATLPGIDICSQCHEGETSGSENDKLLLKHVKEKKEIPWKRIYTVPDHVYFSHRRHVTAAKIQCSICHGNVETLKLPPKSPIVELSMDICMDCHKKRNISNDCLLCHK